MPTIFSRPPDDLDVVVGEGSITLQVDSAELELISSFVYNTRLGQRSQYSAAALTLLRKIAETFGDDFVDNAAQNVDLHVTIEDDQGGVVLSTKSGNYYPTLEV